MGISAISVFENNKDINNICVYLLGEKISYDNKRFLKEIGDKYNREIVVIDVPKIDIPEALLSARWPLSAFTRLYAGELLPKSLDRVIYLDCDTIINGSLALLDNWDVSDKTFWGVKDCISKSYKRNIGISPDGLYVNAGVLLINLVELKQINIKEKLSAYMEKYKSVINYADQDLLNGVFCKNIGSLPPQYNLMTIAAVYGCRGIQRLRKPTNYYQCCELEAALNNPIIIHYTTNMRTVRPWFSNTDHPFADEFRKYMSMSPWKNKKMSYMKFTSYESKIIGLVEFLPNGLAQRLLGFLHATIKPIVNNFKVK